MDEKLVDAIVERVMKELAGGQAGSPAQADSSELVTDHIRNGKVMIGVSVRHVHLTNEDFEVLFGKGAKITVMRPLFQPGEFAAEQQVTLVSPTGKCLGPVRVLGGVVRKRSQVELSLSDCYAFGLKKPPPVRPSGDHRESFGITVVGPKGAVTLEGGLIRANRHIHLHTSQAAAMGLKDGEYVDVRVEGDRPTVFLGIQVRASDAFRAEMHLDTDDANAAGVSSGDLAQILLKRSPESAAS